MEIDKDSPSKESHSSLCGTKQYPFRVNIQIYYSKLNKYSLGLD